MSADEPDFEAELHRLLNAGRKIEAIKLYRERTGTGLKEAKNAVEALEAGNPLKLPEPLDSAVESEIVSLLKGGKKIAAIKLYQNGQGQGSRTRKTPWKPSRQIGRSPPHRGQDALAWCCSWWLSSRPSLLRHAGALPTLH